MIPSLRTPESTLPLRTLEWTLTVRILNRNILHTQSGFLGMIYESRGNGDKFLYKKYGLGRASFHARVPGKLKVKNISHKHEYCKIIDVYHKKATTTVIKSHIIKHQLAASFLSKFLHFCKYQAVSQYFKYIDQVTFLHHNIDTF